MEGQRVRCWYRGKMKGGVSEKPRFREQHSHRSFSHQRPRLLWLSMLLVVGMLAVLEFGFDGVGAAGRDRRRDDKRSGKRWPGKWGKTSKKSRTRWPRRGRSPLRRDERRDDAGTRVMAAERRQLEERRRLEARRKRWEAARRHSPGGGRESESPASEWGMAGRAAERAHEAYYTGIRFFILNLYEPSIELPERLRTRDEFGRRPVFTKLDVGGETIYYASCHTAWESEIHPRCYEKLDRAFKNKELRGQFRVVFQTPEAKLPQLLEHFSSARNWWKPVIHVNCLALLSLDNPEKSNCRGELRTLFRPEHFKDYHRKREYFLLLAWRTTLPSAAAPVAKRFRMDEELRIDVPDSATLLTSGRIEAVLPRFKEPKALIAKPPSRLYAVPQKMTDLSMLDRRTKKELNGLNVRDVTGSTMFIEPQKQTSISVVSSRTSDSFLLTETICISVENIEVLYSFIPAPVKAHERTIIARLHHKEEKKDAYVTDKGNTIIMERFCSDRPAECVRTFPPKLFEKTDGIYLIGDSIKWLRQTVEELYSKRNLSEEMMREKLFLLATDKTRDPNSHRLYDSTMKEQDPSASPSFYNSFAKGTGGFYKVGGKYCNGGLSIQLDRTVYVVETDEENETWLDKPTVTPTLLTFRLDRLFVKEGGQDDAKLQVHRHPRGKSIYIRASKKLMTPFSSLGTLPIVYCGDELWVIDPSTVTLELERIPIQIRYNYEPVAFDYARDIDTT